MLVVQVSSSNGIRRNKRGAKCTHYAIMQLQRYPSADYSKIKTSPLSKGRELVKMGKSIVTVIALPPKICFKSLGKEKNDSSRPKQSFGTCWPADRQPDGYAAKASKD